jgi:hypothetical protein
MSEPRREEWDLESVYDEQINPLMARIIAICKANRLPMFASFAYRKDSEDERTDFCTTSLPFEGRDIPQLKAAEDVVFERGGFIAMTITGSR